MKLRISMRTVLWLAAIAAILAAWATDRWRMQERHRNHLATVERRYHRQIVDLRQSLLESQVSAAAMKWDRGKNSPATQ
jgi:hypothetical protein